MTGLHVGSTSLYAASRCGSPSRVYSREVESTGLQVGSTGLYAASRCGSPSRVYSLEVESTGVQVGSTGFGVVIYMLPHDVAYPAGSTSLQVGSTGLQSGLTGIQAATLTFRGARKRVSKQSQSASRKPHISRRQLTLPPV